MKPILTPLFLPLFLHIIAIHVAGDTSPIYTPVDDITLQCGFSGDQLNPDDTRTWTGDINSKFSPFENQAAGSPSISRQAPSSSSVSQVPYRTVRLSRSEFTYRFPVTTGQKFIRLYFYPASYGPDFDRSKALFSVKAGGFTLLKDFNSSVTADASGSDTIYREFCLNVESEQSLNITFKPSRATSDAYAFINGIEIVSMPNNLYYTSAQNSDGVKYIGSDNTFPIENGTALEMVYRFNVGGRSLFFNQDTGMYRTPPQSPKISKKSSTSLIAIIAGLVSGVLVLGSVLGFFLVFRRGRKNKYSSSNQGMKWGPFSFPATHITYGPSYLCRYFTLAEIKAATRNLDDSFIIGVGGFGNVYKGCIDDGATLVAIKRLKSESSQGAHEFKTEIELLSQFRHRYLVSLIGYCNDGNEMVLVYDYMSRGTLASHLYHTDNPPLSWDQRLQICIGAAIGLRYLHSGTKGTIIHRDVKSTNILLNEKWMAKISDFGLSKMSTINTSKTHISTMVKGSFGYLDPEYYKRQRLTEKSDVYSFGVVLCEVLCARPAVMHNEEPRQMNLAKWAKSCHRDGELDQIIDPSIRGEIEIQSLNKFVEIAMSCMNDSGIERPSMNDVVKGLELAFQLHRNCVERSNEVAFNNDSAAEIRSVEPGCATNESIQCISETIFSEINDPNGR
ncbi:receptor-like protein kinase FERONIA [Prunus avium]|uniref:Receptor-like protein kinase FERONIA n=1 Tax=Prunus avium TaxID=42229 RepID=A0A6P5RIE4_PRUAV|nr:receptor-like protein kinase FERONIA [Prunus avium]